MSVRGIPLSVAHREKIAASLKGRVLDPVWRERIAQTLKAKSRVERKAECHPDRKHHCKGLCIGCYTHRRHKQREQESAEYREQRRLQRNESTRRWQLTHGHDRHLRRSFGITGAQYDEMLLAQGGACAICGASPTTKRLAVDHCHETGAVRGLLCGGCNLIMGKIDSQGPIVAERLLSYVAKAVRTRGEA